MALVPDVERQMLLRSGGTCNFTSIATKFRPNSSNSNFGDGSIEYEPGILVPAELSSSQNARVVLIPRLCEAIITDRNLGDNVFIDLIQRDNGDDNPKWYKTSSHWYRLGSLRNEGLSEWGLELLHPKTLLNKGETIYWSDEYTRRKYNNDPWFENISIMQETITKIKLD